MQQHRTPAVRLKNGVLASQSDMRQDRMEISLWEVFLVKSKYSNDADSSDSVDKFRDEYEIRGSGEGQLRLAGLLARVYLSLQ